MSNYLFHNGKVIASYFPGDFFVFDIIGPAAESFYVRRSSNVVIFEVRVIALFIIFL